MEHTTPGTNSVNIRTRAMHELISARTFLGANELNDSFQKPEFDHEFEQSMCLFEQRMCNFGCFMKKLVKRKKHFDQTAGPINFLLAAKVDYTLHMYLQVSGSCRAA